MLRFKFTLAAVIVLIAAGRTPATAQSYTLRVLAGEGDTVDGRTLSSFYRDPSINDDGEVAYISAADRVPVIITQRRGILVEPGDEIAGEAVISVNLPSINNAGDVAFVSTGPSIYITNGTVARKGTILGPPSLNDEGLVAFLSSFAEPERGAVQGIFTQDGALAQSGDVIDDRLLTADRVWSAPDLDDAGVATFRAAFEGSEGIFTQREFVAGLGSVIDGKTIRSFRGRPLINNAGVVAFVASFVDEEGVSGAGILSSEGLIIADGDPVEDRPVMNFNGEFGLNDAGEVAFTANFPEGAGLPQGLFTQHAMVARAGQEVDGRDLRLFLGRPVINSRGDIAVLTQFGDLSAGILLATKNAPSTCMIEAPPVVSCGDDMTQVRLRGRVDGVEGGFLWTTDRPEAFFDDPTSPAPTLVIDTAALGCNVKCRVTLEVEGERGTLTCSATVTVFSGNGPPPLSRLRFDRPKYRNGECVELVLHDADENRVPGAAEQVEVVVGGFETAGNVTGDLETVTLVETGPDTGVFRSRDCLRVSVSSPRSDNGVLEARAGDVIAAVYQDPDNPAGGGSIAEFDLAADTAFISGGPTSGSFRRRVDSERLPPELAFTSGFAPGEGERPLALVVDPDEVPMLFGEDQVVLAPRTLDDLEDFLRERGGTVVDTVIIPSPDPELVEPLVHFVIRVEPDDADLADLDYLMELAGMDGDFTFSSERSLGLAAILLEEQLGGRSITHNSLAWFFDRPETDEEGALDGFSRNWMNAPDLGLRQAILHLDLIDRNAPDSVRAAVVDGGFASLNDYANPLDAGDYGRPFDNIVQGNCAVDCSGSAGGPMTLPCAAGFGKCPWHGTSVWGLIGAVAGNGSGVAGVAGHARDPATGEDGQRGLVEPMLFKIGFPYMTATAKAVAAAHARGADVINVSSGFPCKPLLGINLCDGTTRTLVSIACSAVAGVFLSIAPPIAVIIETLGCGTLRIAMGLAGYSDADTLRESVAGAIAGGTVIVASGPEDISLGVFGAFGPFEATEIQMLPCVLDGVICVGSLAGNPNDPADRQAATNNQFCSGIDIWAPGEGLQSMVTPETQGESSPGARLSRVSGTSAAAPMASGVVSLILAADPTLTPAGVLSILQRTSRPFPPGKQPGGSACTTHPSAPGPVGFIDALAAVREASGITLPCDGWDETDGVDDRPISASPLVIDATPGNELDRQGAIHALPFDEDWVGLTVMGSAGSVKVDLILEVEDPSLGTLALELYRGPGQSDDLIDRQTADDGEANIQGVFLFTGWRYPVRVIAEQPAGIHDNCYTLRVRVTDLGPGGDRFEPNDSRAGAAPLVGPWSHAHHDPRIFEDGAAPPRPELIGGWHSGESWTMTIADLSLHSLTDTDFFDVSLPDPANPAVGGHAVFADDCGETSRRGFEAGTEDVVQWSGSLTIAVRSGSRGRASSLGETLKFYDPSVVTEPERVLNWVFDCPRSDLGLDRVVFSMGEEPELRLPLPYTLTVTYAISIARIGESLPYGRVRGLPCPGGFFPDCEEFLLEGRSRFLTRHPLGDVDPLCLVDGCPEPFLFEWPARRDLEARFESGPDLSFEIRDLRDRFIARAIPMGGPGKAKVGRRNKGGVEVGAADGESISQSLLVPDLEPGSYLLVVSGGEGSYLVDFAVGPSPSDGGLQRPSDCNQDGVLDISDGLCLLGHLFLGNPAKLPCGNGAAGDPANLALLNANGDASLDISDVIQVFGFLFLGGPPPVRGKMCTPTSGCPDACSAEGA